MGRMLTDLITKLGIKTNPAKYYPNAGPARREGQLPIRTIVSFANPAAGILPDSPTPPITQPPVVVSSYLSTESGNRLTAENGNNIIL